MTNIWKEGKHLDLWSVTHFLSGIVIGGWLIEFGVSTWWALGIYVVVAVAWEIFEIYHVPEHVRNRFIDVILGVAGLGLYLLVDPSVDALAVVTVVYIVMEVHGYLNYRSGK